MIFSNLRRVISILCILCCFSCYEKQIDCLDTESTNYAIGADEQCEECCTYPKIVLVNNHFLGGDVYHPDSVLTNNFGQKYNLQSAYFFLHDFTFEFSDGEITEVLEFEEFIDINEELVESKNDYILVKTGKLSNNLGTFRKSGIINSIRANIGVNNNLQSNSSSNTLSKNDSLYVNQEYKNFVINVQWGDDLDHDKQFTFSGVEHIIQIQKNVSIEKTVRTQLSISILIDYQSILDQIDFENMDNDSFFDVVNSTNQFIQFLP